MLMLALYKGGMGVYCSELGYLGYHQGAKVHEPRRTCWAKNLRMAPFGQAFIAYRAVRPNALGKSSTAAALARSDARSYT